MADERQWNEWNHTAQICAVIATVMSGKKAKIQQFHPLMAQQKTTRSDITVLKDVFVEGKMPAV